MRRPYKVMTHPITIRNIRCCAAAAAADDDDDDAYGGGGDGNYEDDDDNDAYGGGGGDDDGCGGGGWLQTKGQEGGRRKGQFGLSNGKDGDKDDKAASCLYTC